MHVEDLPISFHKWRYRDYLFKEKIEKALRLTLSDENKNKKVNGVSLAVAYTSYTSQVARKSIQLSYEYQHVRKVFSPAQFFPCEA